MLQRYKLRLGDGTVLLVDYDGLSTWLVDKRATVQAEGGRTWQPLKEFLARERVAARRRESGRRAGPPQALPLVPPPPREEGPFDTSPPTPREDGLPLVPPPPPREDGLPLVPPPPPREDGLPLIPPPPPREEGLPLVRPPTPGKEEPLAPVLPPAPREDGLPPTDEALPLLAPPPEEPVPLIVPPSGEDEPLPAAATPPEGESPARVTVGPPRSVQAPSASPAVQVLADEPSVPRGDAPGPTPLEDLPVIPLKRLDDEGPRLPARGDQPVATPDRPPAWTRMGGEGVPLAPRKALSDRRTPTDEIIRLDPRLAAALQVAATFGSLLSRCLVPINRLERRFQPFPVDAPAEWLDDAPSSGSFPVTPVLSDRAQPGARARSEEPSWFGGLGGRPSQADVGRALSRTSKIGRGLLTNAIGWIEGVSARLARVGRRGQPRPSVAPGAPAEPMAPHTDPFAPPAPLPPPLHLSELPVLRLAPTDEPQDVEDVYEGHEGESLLPAIWLWAKRLVCTAVLVAGGVLAARTWDVWFPRAARLGQITFAEVDKRARSSGSRPEQREALEEASGQLPHLAPETIRLVLSSSPTGILDPPDVFELACEATDRGLPALTTGEAEELKGLRQELLATLRPAERERIREYDRARVRGVVFPLDNRQALLLYARGARGLPSAERQRLQLLLGKAIAAGLAPPTDRAARAAAGT